MTSPFQTETLAEKNDLISGTFEKDGNQQIVCLSYIIKQPPLVFQLSYQNSGEILSKEELPGGTR